MQRWAKGLRVLAVAWFMLLMHAWLYRHIGAADVVLFGALPGAIYWTAGRALIRWCMYRDRPLAGRH
jgi:hypothetical protein